MLRQVRCRQTSRYGFKSVGEVEPQAPRHKFDALLIPQDPQSTSASLYLASFFTIIIVVS